MTNNSDHQPQHVRHRIDFGAFFYALIIAPISVAVLGFWILLIPVMALIIGGLPYLVIGGPIMAIFLQYQKPTIAGFALLGAAGNIAAYAVARMALSAGYITTYASQIDFVFKWGMIFSPIWTGVFAYIYCQNLTSENDQSNIDQ